MGTKVKRVALQVNTAWVSGRELLRGVADFVRHRPDWRVILPDFEQAATMPFPTRREVDGVITQITDRDRDEAAAQLGVPVVDLGGYLEGLRTPQVAADNRAIGTLVAGHFLDRGYRRFGFYTVWTEDFVARRRQGFVERLEEAGYECIDFEFPSPRRAEADKARMQRKLTKWVVSVPKPIGVFASTDACGQLLTEICHAQQIRVPEEVAVVGVGNDEVLCDLSRPRLSSVDKNQEKVGYDGAALLDQLMSGQAPARTSIRVPPIGVVARPSSDILVIDDPEVAQAVQFIRQRSGRRPPTIQQVLDVVPVSRRSLERRFRRLVGRTIASEIRRNQIAKARDLLATTDMPGFQVAMETGFRYQQRFSAIFKRETGMTPTEYRRRYRGR